MNQKVSPGIFADPTVDFAFKRIFGTEQYKAATIGFLNSVICPPKPIVDVTFINVELPGLVPDDRKAVVDVSCTADDGSTFIVEMQNFTHSFFRERMVVYASSLVTHLAEKSARWNYKLSPVYVIAILRRGLTYPFKAETPMVALKEPKSESRYKTHYATINLSNGILMPSSPQYYFFELDRFDKKRGELLDDVEKWLFLLKESVFFKEVPAEFSDGDDFRSFFSASTTAGFSKEERMKYDKDMITQTDIEIIKEESLAEGLEKGFEKGILLVAKNLKADGMPAEKIAQVTGLLAAEVEKL